MNPLDSAGPNRFQPTPVWDSRALLRDKIRYGEIRNDASGQRDRLREQAPSFK